MKRFAFTLETVYEYKQTVEKTRKSELAKAQAVLRELNECMEALGVSFQKNAESMEKVLKRRTGVAQELEKHDAYFRYLRDEKKRLEAEILKAEIKRDKCMELVIEIMKEVKAYKNLREEQYLKYLEEIKQEEAKDINDLVSFQTITQS